MVPTWELRAIRGGAVDDVRRRGGAPYPTLLGVSTTAFPVGRTETADRGMACHCGCALTEPVAYEDFLLPDPYDRYEKAAS
jgi:hypothetical protein